MGTRLSSFLKGHRAEAVMAPLFKLLEAVFELLVPLVVASLIDIGIANGDTGYIARMALLLVVLAAVGLASSVTAQYFSARAATGFAEKMKSALFMHIQSLSEKDRDEIGTSTLITRLTSDATLVQNGINMFLRLAMRSPFVVFGAAIMAFTVDSTLAWIFVIVIPVLSMIVAAIMMATVPMYRRVQNALDGVAQRTRDNLKGARVLRAFCRTEDEEKAFSLDIQSMYSLQMLSGRISALLNPLTYAVINGAIAAIIWFGRERFMLSLIEIGSIVALVNYMNQILAELVKLANLIVTISRAVASGKRIQAVFDREPSMKDGTETGKADDEIAVAFDSVSLSYNDAEPSLKDISFIVRKGECIGIIGGTGSGKTTLINLIPRFYDATAGSVTVFGRNVQNWTLSSLRSMIGVVPQKAVLFKGTVRDNMLFAKENASDEEIEAALKMASAYSFVEEKGGLGFAIEQRGQNLSGGQRQRLAIARALLRQPDILILDDSTSALDFKTEAEVRKSISSIEDSTVFIVSQRVSSVMHADKIIVLDKGSMAGIGTHQELLSDCPVYQEIFYSQTGEGK